MSAGTSAGCDGSRIAAARKSRRMTQWQLAQSAAISVSLLRKIEQGTRPLSSAVRRSIADALGLDDLLSAHGPHIASSRVHASIPEIRKALDCYDLPKDGPVLPLREFQALTEVTTAHRLAAHYAQLAAILPELLGGLTRAVHTSTGHDQEMAYALLTMAYRSADAIADKLGYVDLSARIIDLIRLAADEAADPLLIGMAAYVRAEIFFTNRHPADGMRGLDAAINSLRPGSSRSALAVYGTLHMRAAVVAAGADLPKVAESHIAEARDTARRIPDGVCYGTAFGPASVRIHEIAAAAELGDGHAVLAQAARWHPPPTLSAERRSHYFIEVARAHLWTGMYREAFASLQEAKTIAPQQVRHSGIVRQTVATLLRLQRHPSEPLLDFARWTEAI